MLITSNVFADRYAKLFDESQICDEAPSLDLRVVVNA